MVDIVDARTRSQMMSNMALLQRQHRLLAVRQELGLQRKDNRRRTAAGHCAVLVRGASNGL